MPIQWGEYFSGLGQGMLDRMAGSMWDSMWGGITTGNWGGGTSKERKNQIHDIRTLRRREYQDMVHSLTEAGLNPVLALGASPGHATAQQVHSPTVYQGGIGGAPYASAAAKAREAGVKEDTAPSIIGRNRAQTGMIGVQTENALYDRANIIQQFKLDKATIDQIRQNTKTAAALEALHRQDAITKGASAREIDEKVRQYQNFGLPGQSWEGILRQIMTHPGTADSAKKLAETLGLVLDWSN